MDIDPKDLDNGSLSTAIFTAFANDDKAQMKALIENHVNSAPTISDGLTDIVNGLTFVAGTLLLQLAKATGRDNHDLLQEIGMLFADRAPLEDSPGQ